MDMKFEIGEVVWWAHPDTTEKTVECPDCGGTGRLRVTFHDETQVSIPCQNCTRGFEEPTGRIAYYDRSPSVQQVTITGVDITDGKTEWRTTGSVPGISSRIEEKNLSRDVDEAAKRCEEIAEQSNIAELARIMNKEKDTRSWAWNATYHRKEIKECERRIVYHTAKLNAANLKARKPK